MTQTSNNRPFRHGRAAPRAALANPRPPSQDEVTFGSTPGGRHADSHKHRLCAADLRHAPIAPGLPNEVTGVLVILIGVARRCWEPSGWVGRYRSAPA